MQNQEDILGYNLGHDDGYCRIPPKFLSNEEEESFVENYLSGYYLGKQLREDVEARIEKQLNGWDP